LHARDAQSGAGGDGEPLAAGEGISFFSVPSLSGNANDPEVFLKVVDEQASNGTFSLLHGGLTNLEYTITVTDTATRKVWQFTHLANTCGESGTIRF